MFIKTCVLLHACFLTFIQLLEQQIAVILIILLVSDSGLQ